MICLIIFVAGYRLSTRPPPAINTFLIQFIANLGEDRALLVESLLLFFALLANVLIVAFDTGFYHNEIHTKAALLAKLIKDKLLNSSNPADLIAWSTGKFCPQLHLPQSPCITLQWTLRDGHKVNLPALLLVKGDVIYLCPVIELSHCSKSLKSVMLLCRVRQCLAIAEVWSPSEVAKARMPKPSSLTRSTCSFPRTKCRKTSPRHGCARRPRRPSSSCSRLPSFVI